MSHLSGTMVTKTPDEGQILEEVGRVVRLAARPYLGLVGGQLEDLQQEVALVVLEALRQGTFEGRSSIATYTRRIVHHKCVDLVRASRRRRFEPLDEFQLSTQPKAHHRVIARDDVQIALRVQRLAGEQCTELWRSILAGKTYDAMAQELGVSPGTLRVRALRCRRKALALRDQLLRERRAARRKEQLG